MKSLRVLFEFNQSARRQDLGLPASESDQCQADPASVDPAFDEASVPSFSESALLYSDPYGLDWPEGLEDEDECMSHEILSQGGVAADEHPKHPIDSDVGPLGAFSSTAWSRYATSSIIKAETTRIRSRLPWAAEQSLGIGHTQSTLLSDFLTLPASSLGLLLKDPCTEAEPVHAPEVKEWLRTARHVRIARSDDDIRDVSIDRLRKILLIDPEATRLGELLVPTKGKPLDDHEIKRSIDQAFSKKSSGTLYKRACALSRYIAWYHKLNRVGSPLCLKESDMYRYMNHLDSEGAGATAASGFLEALRFLDGVAIFQMADLNAALSPRVTGYARQMFLRKEPLRQRDPLPCSIVAELERLLIRKIDQVQVCILGQLLWCFHSASRWGDSQKLQKLHLEKSSEASLVVGEALGSKTSLTKEAKTRLLPYVAIGSGLSGSQWAEVWLDTRVFELGRDPDPFLPSFSCKTGRWSTTPMSSTEACSYLQDFVSEALVFLEKAPKIDTKNLGTHSLKTGLLTMASRATTVKFSLGERRTLGHHIKPGDKSVLTYSREAYTSLYGKVLACFLEFRCGKFNPDATPLERVIQTATALARDHAAEGHEFVPGGQDVEDDLHEISSESSEEQIDLIDILGDNEKLPHRDPFPHGKNLDCVVHRKSGVVHCLQSEEVTYCGRHLSQNYVTLDRASIEDMECCILCGRHLAASAP